MPDSCLRTKSPLRARAATKSHTAAKPELEAPIRHRPRTGFQAEDRIALAEGAVHTERHLARRCNLTHALPVQVERPLRRLKLSSSYSRNSDLGSLDRPEQRVVDQDGQELSHRGVGQWRAIPGNRDWPGSSRQQPDQPIRRHTMYTPDFVELAEELKIEVLESAVEGSRLHWIINNPVTEGIDEG
jgi:hypothetical protein